MNGFASFDLHALTAALRARLIDALAAGDSLPDALGLLVAMLAGVDQIRDVMAFPKTQRGQDLMVDTPTPVTEKQLRELHIRLRNTAPQ